MDDVCPENVGKRLEQRFVHRLPEVCSILGKKPGEYVDLQDYVLLATSSRGVFQYAQGRRLLLLTGGEKNSDFPLTEFAACLQLEQADIELCALAHRNSKTSRLEIMEVQEL